MKTSEHLTEGEVYTRRQLSEKFRINYRGPLMNGIFRPTRPEIHDSVWIKLEGDVLEFDGQDQGATDYLIREHRERGLELLLFYRPEKTAYPGYGFRYEGQFRYVSEVGEGPTRFTLIRSGATSKVDLTIVRPADYDAADDTYASSGEDTRIRTYGQIVARRGQQAFRQALRERYGARCMVTGCETLAVVEAAHISPYRGEADNRVENGLLLRADVHTLFDLDLIGIEPSTLIVRVHPSVSEVQYRSLDGKSLHCSTSRPSQSALKARWASYLARASAEDRMAHRE
jgi:putative restriction endonuclease